MHSMNDVRATISIGDESLGVIAGLLKPFPKGSRVRVVLSEEPTASGQPLSLDAYLARLENARGFLPPCPWQTTEEAMRELREGEQD